MRQLLKRSGLLIRVVLLSVSLANCGGGGGTNPAPPAASPPQPPPGTTVTASFSTAYGPLPSAVATSTVPASTWTRGALNGSIFQFTLPPGVDTYAIAYACNAGGTTIVELSLRDTATPTLGCYSNATFGSATFNYDVSAIPGAVAAQILVANPANGDYTSGALSGVTGSTTIRRTPTGTDDVMVQALDSANNVIGAEILRQTAISANGTYTLAPLTASDATTAQTAHNESAAITARAVLHAVVLINM